MLRVTTESGSVHEIDQEGGRVRRVPGAKAGELHADGDWITDVMVWTSVVGRQLKYAYRNDDDRTTIRTTTQVVLIEEI